ncbi:hypothetical protein [Benzoatithermus flavus]|uniref:Response regulatory domain-containing protein n=1 Tax=Benzoatithermus flavus TaxID=3108223 RepID=A0ABU8XNI6_9PROT
MTGRSQPTVLLAESTLLIALALSETVQDLGYRVLGPARSVREALILAQRQRPELALFDAELADGSAAPLAKALRGLRVPFALVTAHDPACLEEPVLRTAPCIAKPYTGEEIAAALRWLHMEHQPA